MALAPSGTELEIPTTMHIESTGGSNDPPAPGTGAPPEGGGEPTERPLSPRERIMADIYARREEAIQRELQDGAAQIDGAGPVEPDPDPEVLPAATPAPGASTAAPQVPAAAPAGGAPSAAPAAPAAPQVVQVDLGGGQIVHVSPEQLYRLAQVGAVALQRQHQPAPPVQAAPQPPAQDPQQERIARLREIDRRLSFGSDDERVSALDDYARLMGQPAGQPIDQGRVVQEAVSGVIQHVTLQQNLATIGGEFPDVFGNVQLARLAALNLDEIRRNDAVSGVTRPDLAAMREACTRVRSVVGSPPAVQSPHQQHVQAAAGTAPQAAPAVSSTRLERKRAAPSTPASSTGRPPPQEQRRAPSGSEVVDAMRRARGQMPVH